MHPPMDSLWKELIRTGWLEAALFSKRPSEIETVRTYAQEIWFMSEEITRGDLKTALAKWRGRRPPPPPCRDMTFVEALKRGRFIDRKESIYIVIEVEELSAQQLSYIEDKAEELQDQFIELQGRSLSAWVDWPDIPREKYIVSYYLGPRGGFYFEQIWKTLPKRCDRRTQNGEVYQFAYCVKANEIGMTAPQRDEMTRIIEHIVNNDPNEFAENLDEEGCCICMNRLLEPPIDGLLDEYAKRDEVPDYARCSSREEAVVAWFQVVE